MNIYGHMKIAEEMGITKGFAIQAQKRYLREQMEHVSMDIDDHIDWVDGVFDINELFALIQLDRLCRDMHKLKQDFKRSVEYLKPSTSRLTDDMIERAKEYPVEQLIDFTRGKAIAFCHDDNHPSMFHATRGNFGSCPVCDRNFGPIDVLMIRDGMNFVSAVKQLQ